MTTPNDLINLQSDIRNLIFTTPKERTALSLPHTGKEAESRLADIVWNHLKTRGHIYHAGGLGYLLLEDHIPIPVTRDGDEFAYLLQRDYLLKPGEKVKDYVGRHIGCMCKMEGQAIEPRLTSHYEDSTRTAYLAELPGWMIRITKDEIRRVPNGTDGQVFLFPRSYRGFTFYNAVLTAVRNVLPIPGLTVPEREKDALFLPKAIDNLLFSGLEFEQSELHDADKKILLTLYLITLWMPGLVPQKTLLTMLGPTGSGKTFFLRVVGKLLLGDDWDVSNAGGGAKEFENAMVNNSLVVFDEFGPPSSDIRSLIKQACTGGKMRRRELYTTAGQIEMPYRAALGFTCVSQPFDAEEETNRQLAFNLKERKGEAFIDEKELLKKILSARTLFISHMASRIQIVLQALDSESNYTPRVSNRLAGYATLLIKLMRFSSNKPDEGEAAAREILTRWQCEQEDRVFVNNDLGETIAAWMNSASFESGKWLTAGELFSKLEPYIPGKPWWSSNSMSLAGVLRRSQGAFEKRFGLRITDDTHKKVKVYNFTAATTGVIAELALDAERLA